MNQAIMAHIVASITVFVNAPPLYLPRRYAIANARIAPMPCSFAARMAAKVIIFVCLVFGLMCFQKGRD